MSSRGGGGGVRGGDQGHSRFRSPHVSLTRLPSHTPRTWTPLFFPCRQKTNRGSFSSPPPPFASTPPWAWGRDESPSLACRRDGGGGGSGGDRRGPYSMHDDRGGG